MINLALTCPDIYEKGLNFFCLKSNYWSCVVIATAVVIFRAVVCIPAVTVVSIVSESCHNTSLLESQKNLLQQEEKNMARVFFLYKKPVIWSCRCIPQGSY